MLIRSLVVVGLVGIASLGVTIASAKDAVGSDKSYAAIEGVSFIDPLNHDNFASGDRFDVAIGQGASPRFATLGEYAQERPLNPESMRSYEVAFVAHAGVAGVPVDVAITQRAALGVNENGDISSQSRGSELRLGSGLSLRRLGQARAPSWYVFAASDDEALTWSPGARNAFGHPSGAGFALQNRIEIGNMQAGITYESGRLQASLAYVEREISVRTGSRTISADESFTGLTLTLRN